MNAEAIEMNDEATYCPDYPRYIVERHSDTVSVYPRLQLMREGNDSIVSRTNTRL